MKKVLEVDSVQKRYDQQIVLSDVYLKCETGDILGILGRNGAGKSSLLKIIFGLVSAENKFVRVNQVVRKRAYKQPGQLIYLSQENFIPKHLSVSKAIGFFLDENQSKELQQDEFIQRIYTQRIRQLSGGELRYLEVLLCLFSSSQFVLLDEPYYGLSPILINKVNVHLIQQSKNKGIILTDHNYRNVLKIATQLYLIQAGALKKLKNKEDLISYGYLKDGMLD